ncbi:MAG: marine proteobacterial sortase target protein [Rhodobacteraceae bacterium]|nr:marine proteobacterial sortase target protein [Paracoccaceae bacterium]
MSARILLAALFALATSFFSPAAMAQDAPRADGLIRADQVDGGALLFFTDEPGLYVQAPLVSTKIDISVAGPIARAVVTQRFRNPAEVFVEGKYLFPLPEGAAVDTLKMRIGDRLIEGEIKEKQQAREIYEQAKAEGYKASLVEQIRPNMFNTSVANIGPDEMVVIQIEYQQTLAPRDGLFGLRAPLVVAPRYTPKDLVDVVKFGPNGWEVEKQRPIPGVIGAGRAGPKDPPVEQTLADPRFDEPGTIRNPVELTVDIDAGFPLGELKSLYHEVDITRGGDGETATASLSGPVPADRDFYLSWGPKEVDDPYAALFSAAEPGEATNVAPAGEHFVFMLTPPALEAIGDTRRPRDVIFVQDVSGSMFGESIEQARKGLEMAVKRLRPEDRFNLIVFNDAHGLYSDTLLPATKKNIADAVTAVRALQADGGTEMLPALEEALKDADPNDDGRVRQVIFLTDGAVSNEREMLRLIEQDLGRSRLFTVGIGSAPNSYFMTAAAEAGRGAHVFIGDLTEVQERMEALFRRIETPAMTDLKVEVVDSTGKPVAAEIWPSPVPDLYAGDPVVATVLLPEGEGGEQLSISGLRGGEAWSETLALSDASARSGVSKLWARRRIQSLESLLSSPDTDAPMMERIDAEILQTALDHHLVSRLTSLVAVDVTPTRPVDEPAVTVDVPTNLPKGWDADSFFGEVSDGLFSVPDVDARSDPSPSVTPIGGEALPEAPAEAEASAAAAQQTKVAKLSLSPMQQQRLVAAASLRAQPAALGAQVPQTSANWLVSVVIGALMMLIGALLGWRLWLRRAAS